LPGKGGSENKMSKIDWSIGTRLTKRKKKVLLIIIETCTDPVWRPTPEIIAFLKDKWKL
jgi:hypothetical protein